MAQRLAEKLGAAGERAVTLSLDDFYLARPIRRRKAASVNALLMTRGPPGTHETELAVNALRSIKQAADASVPQFDKGVDDRKAEWRRIKPPVDVVIFEGWCLGAMAQPESMLIASTNMLERVFDADGAWRRAVNAELDAYRSLFEELDFLVYLRPPSFEIIHAWRAEQERAMIEITGSGAPASMDPVELAFFIQHYERLTRWMMDDLPARADLTLQLDAGRRVVSVSAPRSESRRD